jgi:hypothetical protein
MTLKDEGGKMKEEHRISQPAVGDLFERVVVILDQARSNVARSVNTNMVLAYWLIGREIVLDLQGGDERAEYGKQVLAELSKRLTERFKKRLFRYESQILSPFFPSLFRPSSNSSHGG